MWICGFIVGDTTHPLNFSRFKSVVLSFLSCVARGANGKTSYLSFVLKAGVSRAQTCTLTILEERGVLLDYAFPYPSFLGV